MEFESRLPNGKGRNGEYRIRRFRCIACDNTELIFAEGAKDGYKEVNPITVRLDPEKQKIW